MTDTTIWTYILEMFYGLAGLLLIFCSFSILKDQENKTRIGGFLFWFIMGVLFALGKTLPPIVSGTGILVIGILSLFKQVNSGSIESLKKEFSQMSSDKLGNKIFIPSFVIAIFAFVFAQFLPVVFPESKALSGQIAIGLSAVCGVIAVIAITKAPARKIVDDGSRLVKQIGPTSILPQLLATLGVVFTNAGVGDVISQFFSAVIPDGQKLIAVVVYCLAMAIFTIIMGNSFAAFAVITTGIAVPFIISAGGDPAVVGALGITAGYCGTLLTPMAANFNIVPASLLETKSQYSIIKFQAPLAIALLICHMVLMYFLAF
ncbi:MAG: DUF979 domain-containing protein [Mycoplasmatales bacterium]